MAERLREFVDRGRRAQAAADAAVAAARVPMRAGLYARVSTGEQDPAGQVEDLGRYCAARGWAAAEYVDRGESGATDRRPALDALLAAARARRLDVVVTTRLDRLARSVRHLVNLGAELGALGVELVVVGQAIDTTTPAGRLLFHVLAAIAEFERDLIRERVRAGVRRRIASGARWGRPGRRVDRRRLLRLHAQGLSARAIAKALRLPRTTVRRHLAALANGGARV